MTVTPAAGAEDLARVIRMQQEIATSSLGFEDLMRLICRRTRELVPVSGSVVELVEGSEMVYRAMDSTGPSSVGLRLNINTSMSGLAVRLNETLRCDDVVNDPRVDRVIARKLGIRSMICVPLIDRARPVGVLKVFDFAPNVFSEYQVNLLRMMAGLLSAVIRHAHEAEAKERARIAVSESERTLRTLVDTAYEAVIIAKNDLITQCNPRFLEMFDVTESKVLGRKFADFVAPFERARVAHNIACGYADFYEFTACRNDREFFCVEGRGRTIDLNGERVRISTLRDVTERRRIEDALRRSEADSSEGTRLKNEFMGYVSREILAPLGQVLIHADRLSALGLSPAQHEITQEIRAATETVLGFVDDIRDFSCIEANQAAADVAPLDLDQLIRETAKSFGPPAAAKGLEVRVDADVSLPPLSADAARLRQVLAGLIRHAIGASRAGELITVGTRLLTRDKIGYRVRFEVGEGGDPGLTVPALEQLIQDHGSRAGLNLCRRLIAMMGGELKVDNEDGRGFRFWFTLTLPPVDYGVCGTRLNGPSPAEELS